jgi:WD40 repeat protein
LKEKKESQELTGHRVSSRALAYSSDSKMIAARTNGGMLKIWKLDSGKELCTIKVGANGLWLPTTLCFSADGKIIYAGDVDSIKSWNVTDGTGQEVTAVDFLPISISCRRLCHQRRLTLRPVRYQPYLDVKTANCCFPKN